MTQPSCGSTSASTSASPLLPPLPSTLRERKHEHPRTACRQDWSWRHGAIVGAGLDGLVRGALRRLGGATALVHDEEHAQHPSTLLPRTARGGYPPMTNTESQGAGEWRAE